MFINKNIIAGFVVAVVVVGTASFWGGQKYAERSGNQMYQGAGAFQNMARGEGRVSFGGDGSRGGFAGAPNRVGRGDVFVSGEVVSKNDKGVTVKNVDGGSKIIFFSASTTVSKMSSGILGDVGVGTGVIITGKTNTDGSITAESIQIRPSVQR